MTSVERIVERWKAEGTRLLPPASREQVIEALTHTGKTFSEDVVNLYCLTGGIDDISGDRRTLYFWPLAKLGWEARMSNAQDLAFADYCLDCWRYRFHFENSNFSSVYGGADNRRLADTVEQFFELYLISPETLDAP